VINDDSRECILQYVDLSISGETVGRLLNRLLSKRNKLQSIVCDNGSEFTSKAMFFWGKKSGVKLAFIQPGKPTQNAFIESFNGKFRASCLNQHWFRTLDEARDEIEIWKEHYNPIRPHSSLNYLPPSVFAKEAA
jgi:putative transposase